MANGKRVLFVSEKRAALDVVHRRLVQAGLGDFLFVLHDPKAKKGEIVAQLDRVLAYVNKTAKLDSKNVRRAQRVADLESDLDAYVQEVSKHLGPLGSSAYEAYDKLIEVFHARNYAFDLDNVGEYDQSRLDSCLAALDDYAAAAAALPWVPVNSPWNGLNRAHMSSAFAEHLNDSLTACAEDVDAFVAHNAPLISDLGIDTDRDRSADEIRELAELFKVASRMPEVASGIFSFDVATVRDAAANLQSLCARIGESALQAVKDSAKQVKAASVSLRFDAEVLDDIQLQAALAGIREVLEEDPRMAAWDSRLDRELLIRRCDDFVSQVLTVRRERDWVLEKYESGAFQLDYRQLLYRYENEYQGIFKRFKGSYKSDRQQISCLQLMSTKAIEDEDALELLRHLVAYHRAMGELKENSGIWLDIFPTYYQGADTDTEALKEQVSLFSALVKARSRFETLADCIGASARSFAVLRTAFGTSFSGLYTPESLLKAGVDWYSVYRDKGKVLSTGEANGLDAALGKDGGPDLATRVSRELEDGLDGLRAVDRLLDESFDEAAFYGMGLMAASSRIRSLAEDENGLRLWMDYLDACEQCRSLGLESFINMLAAERIGSDDTQASFLKRFYTLWLDWACERLPAVDSFRGTNRDRAIDSFAIEDRFKIAFAQKRVKSSIIDSLSDMGSAGEIAILRRETAKRRKVMPTRVLFGKIPHLVMALKPCMMMSPLSVSTFLESHEFQFDLVVFDEASQVCTENAIGSILRGKQAVICGDSRQLPPTSFFSSAVSNEDDFDDDEEVFDDDGAFDSVLEEAALLPTQMLLWHYRSRNESLITFSNKEIYDNMLVTFPSAEERSPEHGVEFVFVPDGVYERGRKRGNPIEAARVADLVFGQIELHPDRSLGVIAFGEQQRQAIEAAVIDRRLASPIHEEFFSEEKDEPFFIKSLENVQGDERDTIILSVGYGKDAQGDMRMNFGPINQEGGERRLNVAVTRSKVDLKLVASIRSQDIDSNKVTGRGPRLLQRYLRYAEMRTRLIEGLLSESSEEEDLELSVEEEGAYSPTPLEVAVKECLEAAGLQTQLHVGSSSNRVDVAVINPDRPGEYLFGVLCDGESYREVRSARDRDRLRPDILQVNGWRLTRAWAPDWARNRKEAEERLLSFSKEVKSGKLGSWDKSERETGFGDSAVGQFEFTGNRPTSEVADLKILSASKIGFNDYGFKIYREHVKGVEDSRVTLSAYLDDVLAHESPIAMTLFVKRVAEKLGLKRVTERAREKADSYLASNKDNAYSKNGFVYSAHGTVTAKTKGIRTAAQIAPEELDAGLINVAKMSLSITEDELIKETAKAFGLSRTGAFVDRLHEGIQRLICSKSLNNMPDGRLTVPDDD